MKMEILEAGLAIPLVPGLLRDKLFRF